MSEWMNNQILGITIGQYTTALGIVLVAYIAKKSFAYFFIKVLLPLAQKSKKGNPLMNILVDWFMNFLEMTSIHVIC